jgi:hypothetical protein
VVAAHEGTEIDTSVRPDVPVISSSSGFNGVEFYLDSYTDTKSLQFKFVVSGDGEIYAPLLAAWRAGKFDNPTGFMRENISSNPSEFLFKAGDADIPLATPIEELFIAEHPITIKSEAGTGCFLVQTYAAIPLKLGFDYCVPQMPAWAGRAIAAAIEFLTSLLTLLATFRQLDLSKLIIFQPYFFDGKELLFVIPAIASFGIFAFAIQSRGLFLACLLIVLVAGALWAAIYFSAPVSSEMLMFVGVLVNLFTYAGGLSLVAAWIWRRYS